MRSKSTLANHDKLYDMIDPSVKAITIINKFFF